MLALGIFAVVTASGLLDALPIRPHSVQDEDRIASICHGAESGGGAFPATGTTLFGFACLAACFPARGLTGVAAAVTLRES